MTEDEKNQRRILISYRPPVAQAGEIKRRIAASGMTTNAFMTAAILGNDAPQATRRRPVDVAEVTRLLAMTATLADRLRELSIRPDCPDSDMVRAALAELSEIRNAAFLALGRKP